jgi:hypothetical protein
MRVTHRTRDAAHLMQIYMLDHIIVGKAFTFNQDSDVLVCIAFAQIIPESSSLARIAASALWFDKTVVFPNSRQTAVLSQKPPSNGSKYSFRKTKFNLFEQDE